MEGMSTEPSGSAPSDGHRGGAPAAGRRRRVAGKAKAKQRPGGVAAAAPLPTDDGPAVARARGSDAGEGPGSQVGEETPDSQFKRVRHRSHYPSSEARSSSPLPVGPDILQHAHRRFLERLHPEERFKIGRWWQRHGGRLRIGSACSGSELPTLSWRALAQVLSADLGSDVQVVSSFSCEHNHKKQELIQTMFPETKHLFADAKHLKTKSATNTITKQPCAVPATDFFSAGFPCTDVSSLNTSASSVETGNVSAMLHCGQAAYLRQSQASSSLKWERLVTNLL